MKYLTALPVYNEESHVAHVLEQVREFSPEILAVDDGSKDGTAHELARFPWVRVVSHPRNLGYGAALKSTFQSGMDAKLGVVVKNECIGQAEPRGIPDLVAALTDD